MSIQELNYYINLLNSYLKCRDMSLKKYFDILGIPTSEYRKAITKLEETALKLQKTKLTDLLNKVKIKNIISIKNNGMYLDICKEAAIFILEGLYTNDEFGMLDYYLSKYKDVNLATVSREVTDFLEPWDKQKFSKFVAQERTAMRGMSIVYTSEALSESAENIFIDGVTVKISEEIRDEALRFFEDKKMPKNPVAYKQLCKRLYKGIFKKSR